MEIVTFFFSPTQFKGIYFLLSSEQLKGQFSFPVLGKLPFWQGKQWLLQINFEY